MTPQGIDSLAGLKYLGPQNLLQLIERWMRRSSEVLVHQDPISFRQLLSHVSSSFAVFTVSFWLFEHHCTHPPISSFCPAPNFFLSSSSSPFTHPTSCYHITPALQHPESPGVSCPQLKCQPLQHTSLPASTSSVPGLWQRTSRSVRLIKAPKVTEQFHYEAESTEVPRPDPQLDFSKCRRLLS